MKFFSRIFGQAPSTDTTAIATLLDSQNFHDHPENRSFQDMPRIKKVIELSSADPARCIGLCTEQIGETPDCDIPYSWLCNLHDKAGRPSEALAALHQGLSRCKRVSGLLKKAGQFFLHRGPPDLCLKCFIMSILAQEPPRKNSDPYLYLSYICRTLEMGNAADAALRVVDSFPTPERLYADLQQQIGSAFGNQVSRLQPMLQSAICQMLEEGRLD